MESWSDGGFDLNALLKDGYKCLEERTPEKALSVFRQAEAIKPQEKRVSAAIAFTLEDLHRTAEAQQYFQQAGMKYSDGGWVRPEIGDFPGSEP